VSVNEVWRWRWVPVSVAIGFALGCGQTVVGGQEVSCSSRPDFELPHRDFQEAQACAVVRVCRGDTVIVKIGDEAKRIGLIGVEARGLAEPAGAAAEGFLYNLLAGEAVFVEFPDSNPVADRFGCVPAYVYRAPDGLFVNLELVRQGYADVPEASTFEYRPLFEHFQQRAREAGKGPRASKQAYDMGERGKFALPNNGRAAAARGAGQDEARGGPSQPGPAAPEPAPIAPAPATQAGSGGDDAAADTIVYITAKGAKYHREGCRHLRKSGRPVSLSEARRLGLKPCSQCKPPG
jgi:endonuclease YncB( thermonuclease family)